MKAYVCGRSCMPPTWKILHAYQSVLHIYIVRHIYCMVRLNLWRKYFFVQPSLPMDCRLDKHYINSIKVPTNSQWHNRWVLPLWHYLNWTYDLSKQGGVSLFTALKPSDPGGTATDNQTNAKKIRKESIHHLAWAYYFNRTVGGMYNPIIYLQSTSCIRPRPQSGHISRIFTVWHIHILQYNTGDICIA